MDPGIMDAIKALGVAGGPVFAVLFWLERVERKSCQKEVRDLLIQVLTVTSAATESVVEVSKAVAEVAETGKTTTSTLAQMGQLIRSLGVALRPVRKRAES